MKILIIASFIVIASQIANSQSFDVDTVQYNGGSDTLINIIILGDGYMQNELDQFVNDATKASNTLFATTPFSQYQNYFNVFLIKVPSNESGAANNPENLIDNYFGSTYNAYYDIERLLVPMRNDKITNVLANNFPLYDQVIMVVNDTRYGGSGGWLGTFSVHSSSMSVFLHELGHSFAGLADEYWAGKEYAREKTNMTQETNKEAIKWKNWNGEFGIGLFPHEESPSWHRPHQNCRMRNSKSEYCSVCVEGIVEQIHSIVSPIISYHSNNSTTYPLSFNLNLIEPNPNTLQIKWILNNSEIKINTDSITISETDLTAGSNNLSAVIEDTTNFLRVDKHRSIHLSVVSWNIEASLNRKGSVSVSSKTADISIFPNPFSEELKIEIIEKIRKKLKIEIIDMMGRTKATYLFEPQKFYTINPKNLTKGYYLMRLYNDDILISTHKIIKN